MTEFQSLCIQKCRQILLRFDPNLQIEFDQRGTDDPYLFAIIPIGTHSVELYIYVDEAEYVIDDKTNWISEKWDYRSEADLVNDFARRLNLALESIAKIYSRDEGTATD